MRAGQKIGWVESEMILMREAAARFGQQQALKRGSDEDKDDDVVFVYDWCQTSMANFLLSVDIEVECDSLEKVVAKDRGFRWATCVLLECPEIAEALTCRVPGVSLCHCFYWFY